MLRYLHVHACMEEQRLGSGGLVKVFILFFQRYQVNWGKGLFKAIFMLEMVYGSHYLIEKVRSVYEQAGCILIIYVIATYRKESHWMFFTRGENFMSWKSDNLHQFLVVSLRSFYNSELFNVLPLKRNKLSLTSWNIIFRSFKHFLTCESFLYEVTYVSSINEKYKTRYINQMSYEIYK